MKHAGRRITMRSSRSLAEARTGLFRATLLFGSAALALSLIVVPEIDRRTKVFVADQGSDLDQTVTGSIAPANPSKRFKILRSVMDPLDRGPCIMFPDGSQKGSC